MVVRQLDYNQLLEVLPVEIGKLTALTYLSVSGYLRICQRAKNGLTSGATAVPEPTEGVAGRHWQVDGTDASVGEFALLLDVEGQSVD